MHLNINDARENFIELVQSVLDGNEVTICQEGKPLVHLVRMPSQKRTDPHQGSGFETSTELEPWLNEKTYLR